MTDWYFYPSTRDVYIIEVPASDPMAETNHVDIGEKGLLEFVRSVQMPTLSVDIVSRSGLPLGYKAKTSTLRWKSKSVVTRASVGVSWSFTVSGSAWSDGPGKFSLLDLADAEV
jgi:hypothetical protein